MCIRSAGRRSRWFHVQQLLLMAAGVVLISNGVRGDVIHVPGDFEEIQSAIDAASDGDEIIIAPGTYAGGVLLSKKSLTIRSTDPLDDAIVESTRISGAPELTPLLTISSVDGDGVVVSGLTISGGSAIRGGGADIDASTVHMSHCVFSFNAATEFGGAIHAASSELTITQCVFHANDSEALGGALAILSSDATVTTCGFYGNTSSDHGSAIIHGFSGDIQIRNSVFSGNSNPSTRSTIYAWLSSSAEITSCSIYDDMDGGIGTYNRIAVLVSPTQVRNCVVWDPNLDGGIDRQADTQYCNAPHTQSNVGNIHEKPYFIDPDGPDDILGTPDDDLRLNRYSPCTDRGDNNALGLAGIAEDFNGMPRFVDDENVNDQGSGEGAIVDMGALERQDDSEYHTTTLTPADSIANAIVASIPGDTLVLSPGVYFQRFNMIGRAITLRSMDPDDPDVVASTVLSGDGKGSIVSCRSREGNGTVIRGLTFANGFASSGAAIRLYASSPSIVQCTFRNNYVTGHGGAIYSSVECDTATPVIHECRFIGNFAGVDGGAISVDDTLMTVTNCLFSGNTAFEDCGAIEVVNGYGGAAILNCTFYSNTALYGTGGALHFRGLTPQVANCIFWQNAPNSLSGDESDVRFSLIEGGYPGIGNIDADPRFVDGLGIDGVSGTVDDDLRLRTDSPSVDAGSSLLLPPWILFDLDGQVRRIDVGCVEDTGEGDVPIVDMGCYEAVGCASDVDCDGETGVSDLLALLAAWGTCDGFCPADLTSDGLVDVSDLLVLLSAWGGC